MDVSDICAALRLRGVKLGEPVAPDLVLRVEQELNLRLDPFFKALYGSFDGFTAYDEKSWICLWPLERVLVENRRDERTGGVPVAIGDFMVVSDILMCALDRESSVSLLHEGIDITPSALALFERFLAGEFDF